MALEVAVREDGHPSQSGGYIPASREALAYGPVDPHLSRQFPIPPIADYIPLPLSGVEGPSSRNHARKIGLRCWNL